MKYNLYEISPLIWAVEVNNNYDRAMLFCRYQEFYESPNPTFRGKNFLMFDYINWYSRHIGEGSFTYTQYWRGFNMPIRVAVKCAKGLKEKPNTYDKIFFEILAEIEKKDKKAIKKGYLIGVDDLHSSTFDHELAHAFYEVDALYRDQTIEKVNKLPKKLKEGLKKILLSMGYTEDVFFDEIQAYMSTGVSSIINSETLLELAYKHTKKFEQSFKSKRILLEMDGLMEINLK